MLARRNFLAASAAVSAGLREAAAAPSFQLLFNGAQGPSDAELQANPRSRSAKLRAAVRTAAPVWSDAA